MCIWQGGESLKPSARGSCLQNLPTLTASSSVASCVRRPTRHRSCRVLRWRQLSSEPVHAGCLVVYGFMRQAAHPATVVSGVAMEAAVFRISPTLTASSSVASCIRRPTRHRWRQVLRRPAHEMLWRQLPTSALLGVIRADKGRQEQACAIFIWRFWPNYAWIAGTP